MPHIQLPYGLVRKDISLISRKIYKATLLFSKLPYLNNIEGLHF